MPVKLINVLDVATSVRDDLTMLRDGEWVPDEDSVQCSIDFAQQVVDTLPVLLEALELLKMAAHALETPGDFTPEERQSQVIGDISNFLSDLEASQS